MSNILCNNACRSIQNFKWITNDWLNIYFLFRSKMLLMCQDLRPKTQKYQDSLTQLRTQAWGKIRFKCRKKELVQSTPNKSERGLANGRFKKANKDSKIVYIEKQLGKRKGKENWPETLVTKDKNDLTSWEGQHTGIYQTWEWLNQIKILFV